MVHYQACVDQVQKETE